jgi:short-chain fatty acids transporter
MNFSDRFAELFRKILPSPFTIAIILTIVTFALAALLTNNPSKETFHLIPLSNYWYNGIWDGPHMVFALQMMLMLILGHVLALSRPVEKLIDKLLVFCTNSANAAIIVTFFTLCVSFINWGLGLVFGAIMARKVAENSFLKGHQINYPLIGAAGYSGLMVWHGGLSGSAPIKVAEEGHFLANKLGVIPLSETVFSSMNLWVSFALLIIIPLFMYLLGKRTTSYTITLPSPKKEKVINENIVGAEKLDTSFYFGKLVGLFFIAYSVHIAFSQPGSTFSFITPNYINFLLMGLCLLFHNNIKAFLNSVDAAISGASGILIQFPLYFGIMGIMNSSGLITILSGYFVSISTPTTFPVLTMFSAGIVNIFVPSGGGQWAVQGPVIANAAVQLGTSFPKAIMALAYGDQLTNMLQPFWALPLLGLTGLKAKEILPYTLMLMFIGGLIFLFGLLLF